MCDILKMKVTFYKVSRHVFVCLVDGLISICSFLLIQINKNYLSLSSNTCVKKSYNLIIFFNIRYCFTIVFIRYYQNVRSQSDDSHQPSIILLFKHGLLETRLHVAILFDFIYPSNSLKTVC